LARVTCTVGVFSYINISNLAFCGLDGAGRPKYPESHERN
jgi:hypothetical protein